MNYLSVSILYFRFYLTGTLAILILGASLGNGAEVAFQRHDINPESTYSACAAIDVNHDGKLDIVSGGFWYEAPHWKKHFLRDVQVIRGRYDDYSNLPLDVNGDGWTDLVSVNYRSQEIYWVEHPGEKLSPWKRHLIARPGSMETGRLVDVDGDGLSDIFPNGTKSAFWMRSIRQPSGVINWKQYHFPDEAAGHGIGFGDVNGDGRDDLISPRGWFEAPEDRLQGRWNWHAEFKLARDCGLPIFVWDVDSDGDNDLVWGRGHQIGIYWTEQIKTGNRRSWIRHAVDTSWSQHHSLLKADLDKDGKPELIAGKRFMGHDGKDPGEYDPLVVYSYQFNKENRTWNRNLISWGNGVGFGLDPKVMDIDADGDLDILAPGRSGLYLLENLLIHGEDAPKKITSVLPPPKKYSDHSNLQFFLDESGDPHSIKTPLNWAKRRADILVGLEKAMGGLPDSSRRVPLNVKILNHVNTPNYKRLKITYQAEPNDRVPAYLLIPHDLSGKTAAMLCLHPTSPLGKSQIAGLGGKPSRFYAHELANRGYVCLLPDYPSFGDYDYDFKKTGSHYQSGSMKAIWNNIRAIDLLEDLPEVDGDRIGCIGHSLGGHNATFTAVFDQRLRVIVSSCGFTAFHHYYEGKLQGWTSDRYMPKIREVYGNNPDLVPFDFYEIVAALSPRPFFVNAPLQDSNFEVNGVKKVVKEAEKIYQLHGASDQLKAVYPDAEHDFPEEVRKNVYDWLDSKLKG